jgi:hypothetical protein
VGARCGPRIIEFGHRNLKCPSCVSLYQSLLQARGVGFNPPPAAEPPSSRPKNARQKKSSVEPGTGGASTEPVADTAKDASELPVAADTSGGEMLPNVPAVPIVPDDKLNAKCVTLICEAVKLDSEAAGKWVNVAANLFEAGKGAGFPHKTQEALKDALRAAIVATLQASNEVKPHPLCAGTPSANKSRSSYASMCAGRVLDSIGERCLEEGVPFAANGRQASKETAQVGRVHQPDATTGELDEGFFKKPRDQRTRTQPDVLQQEPIPQHARRGKSRHIAARAGAGEGKGENKEGGGKQVVNNLADAIAGMGMEHELESASPHEQGDDEVYCLTKAEMDLRIAALAKSGTRGTVSVSRAVLEGKAGAGADEEDDIIVLSVLGKRKRPAFASGLRDDGQDNEEEKTPAKKTSTVGLTTPASSLTRALFTPFTPQERQHARMTVPCETLYIAKSKVGGDYGVFAACEVSRDLILGEFTGRRTDAVGGDKVLALSGFALDASDEFHSSWARYINKSDCKVNVQFKQEGQRCLVVATKKICLGVELRASWQVAST